jgi:hypothetical protein
MYDISVPGTIFAEAIAVPHTEFDKPYLRSCRTMAKKVDRTCNIMEFIHEVQLKVSCLWLKRKVMRTTSLGFGASLSGYVRSPTEYLRHLPFHVNCLTK